MTAKRLVTKPDHQKILSTLESPELAHPVPPYFIQSLKKELSKAKKLDPREIPQDLITMNSKFVLRDLGNAEAFQFTLVYPEDSEDHTPSNGKISVLSPYGSAVLGARVGEVVRWLVNGNEKYLRVQELLFQPQ
ncbi:transcription elongation factor GreA/GreB C-terminal domain protein [Leptospira fainei serovar Hurstbridge str. BUT 6]|uniref:Transcription elongation factor GreA/GreB C-terminal domain protein n=1 Tax=Leptospira fainei serovar Hurstbridge str. BUT 6 TaxID=1193011 RepID=S3VZZ8_9LEPT|nr:GreA/GreB family elongation factor [Leptospira fainei]EPG73667.1 transcription elongation factor GreA/GreB C-terminal domain protein [Leptospira fainei serovar Hurstbridge str. BUT 6]